MESASAAAVEASQCRNRLLVVLSAIMSVTAEKGKQLQIFVQVKRGDDDV